MSRTVVAALMRVTGTYQKTELGLQLPCLPMRKSPGKSALKDTELSHMQPKTTNKTSPPPMSVCGGGGIKEENSIMTYHLYFFESSYQIELSRKRKNKTKGATLELLKVTERWQTRLKMKKLFFFEKKELPPIYTNKSRF